MTAARSAIAQGAVAIVAGSSIGLYLLAVVFGS